MNNPYVALLELLPKRPVQVGEVTASSDGVSTVELPSGESIRVRGVATIGSRVFVRDGVIEGAAPTLPVVEVDV